MGIVPTRTAARERRKRTRRQVTGSDMIPIEIGEDGFGVVLNLSETGATIQPVGVLVAGTKHRLRFHLAPEDPQIEVSGEVLWAGNQHTYGIKFIDLSTPNRARVAAWVAGRGLTTAVPAKQQPLAADHTDDSAQLSDLVVLAQSLLSADGAAIAAFDGSDFICRASSGSAPAIGTQLQSEFALLAECVQSRRVVNCNDMQADAHFPKSRDSAIRALLMAPSVRHDRVVAIIECIWSQPHTCDPRDLKMLCSIAEFVPDAPELAPEIALATSEESAPVPICEAVARTDGRKNDAPPKKLVDNAVIQQHRAGRRGLPVLPTILLIFLALAFGWYGGGKWTGATPKLWGIVANARSFLASWVKPTLPDLPTVQPIVASPAALSPVNRTSAPTQASPPAPRLGPPGSQSKPPAPRLTVRPSPPRESVDAPTLPANQTPDIGAVGRIVGSVKPYAPTLAQPTRPTPAPAATNGSKSGSRPVMPSAPITEPIATFKAQPVYPPAALQMHRSGTVVLDATVGTNGKVKAIRVVSGDTLFVGAARVALARWQFKPAAVAGRNIEAETRVVLNFTAP